MGSQHDTVPGRPTATPTATLVCPHCAKVLDAEPNFCPACGNDLRGLGENSDTLDGPMKDTLIDGRYRLLEKLGEGGMGSVFKVEHARMGKLAALKLLRPDHALDKSLKARFLQEARVVARLSHPNTVQVFDSGELEDGGLFITMEYVPGKDLAWHLKAHGPMAEDKALSIGIQLLASLQEAHEAGIVHRDLKPANVMLVRRRKSGEDQVKLLDFGIAKLQEAEGRKSTTGDFIGTPAYMSPEQIRGEALDARSDLYSLGALLFELVTGRQLYLGPNPISVVTQHTGAPVPRIGEVAPQAHVTPAFEAVVRKALAKDAGDRYRDAEQMRAALEALRRQMGGHTGNFTPMPTELADKMLSREDFDRYERSLRLQRTVTPLVALGVVAALAVGGWHLYRRQQVDGPRTVEVEPNDLPPQATPIPLGVQVQGAIGSAAADANDRDLYLAQVPGGPVRVTLEGVPDLNLTLELLQVEKADDGEKLRRRLFLDDVGPGGSERVDGLLTTPGELFLRVEEKPFAAEPNRPSREKALVPYTLKVEAMAPAVLEAEPNDTPSTAQPLPMTKAVEAFAGAVFGDADELSALRPDAPLSGVDWFRVETPPSPSDTVVVAVVPPERGALLVTEGAAFDAWEARRASSPGRSMAAPGVLVQGAPAVFELKPGADGVRRLRVVAAKDTLPGASYRLAAATSAANGVAGVLDLARALADEKRDASRKQLLSAVAAKLAGSPDLTRLSGETLP
ncbi:MAG: protein kinase [Myxococcales bacterium]|nr:protein kinase [Myxococcales bacterium]